jgi:hypothetical protein
MTGQQERGNARLLLGRREGWLDCSCRSQDYGSR